MWHLGCSFVATILPPKLSQTNASHDAQTVGENNTYRVMLARH
jgi:hypothetical protein